MIYHQDISGCLARKPGTTGLSDLAFEDVLKECSPALDRLRKAYENHELPFLHLPNASGQLSTAVKLADQIRCRAGQVVVLGTGGSSLGGRTLAALAEDPRGWPGKPQIHFFDNIDPDSLDRLLDHLDLKSTMFITIS